MQVENQVQPEADQIRAFLGAGDEPVVMVNLLKFRERAEYEDGRATDLSGREAYALYGESMRKLVEAEGGRFLYGGQLVGALLGRVEELWDMVGLVEYPTPGSLLKIASTPEFQEIEKHRAAGLAGQLNLTARTEALEG